MTAFFKRLRRASWTYRQALTLVPTRSGAPVSDLFIWKRGVGWQTFFDLTDMPGLYGEIDTSKVAPKSCVRLFDSAGRQLAEHYLAPPLHARKLLNISDLIPGSGESTGTFCVFHPYTPRTVEALGSHLAERGYVSYRFQDAPLRNYVHGNFDAVSVNGAGGIEFLGGSGLRMREYRLQHELATGSYDIAVVNPTSRMQAIGCDMLLVADGKKFDSLTVQLPPGGCHIFTVKPGNQSQRIVIRSRLVMARPVIFHIENQRLDVLHG